MFIPFIEGLAFGASLIIAIGAQNAFVLRQGVKRNFVFITALVCAISDMTLIALGVGGLGSLIAQSDWLSAVANWGGMLFLFGFGLRSFYTAFKHEGLASPEEVDTPQTLGAAVMATLAFSLLNPHVYLDTVVLIGTLGATYALPMRWWFGGGAMLASFLWFFGLAYGAQRLAPWFEKPAASRILDVVVGIIMWIIASTLLLDILA